MTASFDDEGEYFYLYSLHGQDERIRPYSVDAGELLLVPDHTQSYASVSVDLNRSTASDFSQTKVRRDLANDEATAEIIPYHGSFGCIVRLATRYFCTSFGAPEKALPVADTFLPNAEAACAYGSESLLYASSKDNMIREHAIKGATTNKLSGEGTNLGPTLGLSNGAMAAIKVICPAQGTAHDTPRIVVVDRSGSIQTLSLMSLPS